MSRRQDIQTGEGVALDYRGYGVVEKVDKVPPTNGAIGYAPGATWFNLAGTQATGFKWTNIGGNGFFVGGVQNTTAIWVEDDPSSGGQFQFGSSTALMFQDGILYRKAFGGGQAPAATGADTVIDVFTIPANAFDGTGFRSIIMSAGGNKANNGDTVTAKLFFNATTAVIGSTISGGTAIATVTGATTGGVGWVIQGTVYKYGAANSNTQLYQELGTILGTTHGGCGVAAALTATENAGIICALTINSATTASDCTAWWWQIVGQN